MLLLLLSLFYFCGVSSCLVEGLFTDLKCVGNAQGLLFALHGHQSQWMSPTLWPHSISTAAFTLFLQTLLHGGLAINM